MCGDVMMARKMYNVSKLLSIWMATCRCLYSL